LHCVTIVYPNKEGATFNFDYYLNQHMPMAAKLLGNDIEIRKGISSAAGDRAPYVCICSIRIHSVDEFVATMTKDGAALIADIPNYTNIEPMIQIDEVVLDMAMKPAA
jgi:uncharacterized protein (TIGR02118 family)